MHERAIGIQAMDHAEEEIKNKTPTPQKAFNIEALKPKELSAKTREVCNRLTKSYGARSVIFSFLSQIEQTELQLLSKWWYNLGVGQA